MSDKYDFTKLKPTIEKVILEFIDKYQEKPENVDKFANEIIQLLKSISKNFKFLVNCLIFENKPILLKQALSTLWYLETDGFLTIEKSFKRHKLIITIFGLSY